MSMPDITHERKRGIVWVCDLKGSSELLSNKATAPLTEEFMRRMYWFSSNVVQSAGGHFIKWTGDGFLAWFEVSLHRDLSDIATRAIWAAWNLSQAVNATQLGVNSDKRLFSVRHGMTYEQDAYVLKLKTQAGEQIDLLGRAVVLAFRISSIECHFPYITAHRDIVENEMDRVVQFGKWKSSKDKILKYFKGVSWQTDNIYVTIEKKTKPRSIRSTIRNSEKVLASISKQSQGPRTSFTVRYLEFLREGPEWARGCYIELTKRVVELHKALSEIVRELKEMEKKHGNNKG